jgi:putative oxygen-independent coproporphyrinogen III oxidase
LDQNLPLGIYIHWPFCLAICPYCDFNRTLYKEVHWPDWENAYIQELDSWKERTPHHQVHSVFFGGGTPSLMKPEWVHTLINAITKRWSLHPRTEITLEMNPTSIEVEKLRSFQKAGVNRISMGIQSLSDQTLAFLGRKHSVTEALTALENVRHFFDRFSFDLIFGHKDHEDLTIWQQELKTALQYAGSHLSLYQLTYEKGTPFYQKVQAGTLPVLSSEKMEDLYDWTTVFMQENGFFHYEISNYARDNQECLHNLIYWRSQDHIGLGPGAHARLTQAGQRYAFSNHRLNTHWLKSVQETHTGFATQEPLNPEEYAHEKSLMGLRLAEGMPLDATTLPFFPFFSEKKEILKKHHLVQTSPVHQLVLTSKGRANLDSILLFLFSSQNPLSQKMIR